MTAGPRYSMIDANSVVLDKATGKMTPAFFQFLQNVFQSAGNAGQGIGQQIQSITVTASPFSYTSTLEGTMAISNAGASVVSDVTLTRQGATVDTGQTFGMVKMLQGDTITVTYSVKPTMNFIPR